MTCSLCNRSEEEQKDIAILIRAGELSNPKIAAMFNTSKDTVRRHRQHVLAEPPPAPDAPGTLLTGGDPGEGHKYNFVQDLIDLKTTATTMLAEAKKEKKHAIVIQYMREIRNQIETIIKVALAQRELEQRDLDEEEMAAGVKQISDDLREIINQGLEYGKDLDGADDAVYEVVEDEEIVKPEEDPLPPDIDEDFDAMIARLREDTHEST